MLNNANITKDFENVSCQPIVMSLSPDCSILSYTKNAAPILDQIETSFENYNLFDFIHNDDFPKCEELIDSITPGLTLEVDFKTKSPISISENNRGVVFQLPHEFSNVMNEMIWVTIPKLQKDNFPVESRSEKKYNFVIIEDKNYFFINPELNQLLGTENNDDITEIIFDSNRRKIDFDKFLSSLTHEDLVCENFYLKDENGKYILFSGNLIKHTSDIKNSLVLILSEITSNSKLIAEYNNSDIEFLREKIESRDKFFSVIAHDLRSPFTAILGYSEYMASYYENLTRDEIHDFSNNMYKASKSVFKLLEDLLKWTRIQSGRITLDKERFSLIPTIDRAVDMFKTTAEKKDIKIVYNSHSKDVFINADEEMISSVLRNLISNGIKFTDSNGFVKVDVNVEDGFVIISVIDNGVGIDKVTLSKLFKVGERVTRYGTNDEEGSGLGLILSKEFILKNGGDILVESQMGAGSTFNVKIPITD